MNVIYLLEHSIRLAGGEGLVNCDQECGCQLGDLAPCGNIDHDDCELAWNNPVMAEGNRTDYWMQNKRPTPHATEGDAK